MSFILSAARGVFFRIRQTNMALRYCLYGNNARKRRLKRLVLGIHGGWEAGYSHNHRYNISRHADPLLG